MIELRQSAASILTNVVCEREHAYLIKTSPVTSMFGVATTPCSKCGEPTTSFACRCDIAGIHRKNFLHPACCLACYDEVVTAFTFYMMATGVET